MKIATEINSKIEKNEIKMKKAAEEKELLQTDNNIPFAQLISQANLENNSNITLDYLSSLPVDYNYDSMMMDFSDAMFFINLTKEGQFSIAQTPSGEFKNLMQIEVAQTEVTQKTLEVTNKLTELIQKAQTTQKPIRITFDNNVSVIIKIDKQGKISAEFIPGSIEVENYLKNNIDSLKQKLEEQNLPYNELLYRQNSKEKRQNKNNRGEN